MAEEITTEEFWNCECPIYFHHHKTISKCLNCNTMKEEQPDSAALPVELNQILYLKK